jgi:hypothetical protein
MPRIQPPGHSGTRTADRQATRDRVAPYPPARPTAPAPGGASDLLPRRPTGPNLPISRPRVALWQWTRQLPDAPLIDNSAELARTGIRDAARLLPRPAGAAPPAPPATHTSGFFLQGSLPIPPMPSVSLPAGDAPHVAAARGLVVAWLQETRAVAAEIHCEQASPDDEPHAMRKLDKLTAPAIVAALNARHEELRLVYAHNVDPAHAGRIADPAGMGSIAWGDFVCTAPAGRWQVLVDNECHNLALDVVVTHAPGSSGRRGSIVAFNPSLLPPTTRAFDLADLAGELKLPPDWPLLMAEVPAQKSERSCRIFALSMALKAHRDQDLARLHQARLQGAPTGLTVEDIVATQHDSDSDSDGGRTTRAAPVPPVLGQAVASAAEVAGPQFMKHAHARSDLDAYIDARGADALAPVNRKGQTLLQRHDAHRVLRKPEGRAGAGPRIYSASIELKRLQFLDLAIRHAARCEGGEVLRLAQAMQAVDIRWVDRYAS